MNKLFIDDIVNLGLKHCGQEYIEKIAILRSERERILHNIWRDDVIPEKFEPCRKETFYRDIDYDTAIHYARKCLDDYKYLKYLNEVADLAINYGELNRAENLINRIIHRYLKVADNELLAAAYHKLGDITLIRNDYITSETDFKKSLQYYTSIKNPKAMAVFTNASGIIKIQLNKIDQGITLFKKAIKLCQTAGDNITLEKVYSNLGNAYAVRGKWNQALQNYTLALNVKNIQNQKTTLTDIYSNLALTYKHKNDLSRAWENLKKSLELIEETKNKYQKGLAYLLEAELFYSEENLTSATAFATSAFVIFTEIGDRLSVAEAYKIMGMINRKNGEHEVALSFLENSRRINDEMNNFHNLAETLIEIGELHEETGDEVNALKAYKLAVDSFEKIEADEKINTVLKHIERLKKQK
ncbi:MAG: tetratricopeptide repeat protein [Candidatus Marinimicrobia bacterium]|nr:tetratricopeptide repeat protein [Candidatus Neomarinimicrobiota bacterium]